MYQLTEIDVTGSWEEQAQCRTVDGDLFFTSGAMQEHRAKGVCKTCPVRWECLAYALRHRVDHGVWGGMTERERRKVLNRARTTAWDPIAAMQVAAPAAS